MDTRRRSSLRYCRKTQNKQARLRLIINNDLPVGRECSLAPSGGPEVRSQLLDMTNPRIFDLSPRDLLDGALRDTAASSNVRPTPFRRLEAFQDEFVHRSHNVDSNPGCGFTQPSNGADSLVRWPPMPRPRTPVSPTSPAMEHFIANVRALLPVSFPLDGTDTDRIEELAKRAGVGKETVRRALKGDAKSRVDTLEKVSGALGAVLAQMVTPGYGALRAREQLASARQEPLPTRRQAGPTPNR